jgi:DNA repair exonuclease SbcCD ATPase subunit/DNA repair exonuclease SbcCD nuclease subunit
MENTKFIINKYKNKTFKEVKEIIQTTDNKYFSFLQRSLFKDKIDENKKENISNFLKYFETNDDIIEDISSSHDEIPIHKKIIETNIEIVSKVYHISDIHIRLYSRFDEYNTVFNNLYTFLRNKKSEESENGIIVITGDLLHSKNQLSPECILITYNFLKELAEIFPTFLIAGNHDALLTNNQRIDSITAIIKNRNIHNLHYLKKTGSYTFANICFGVCSLLDSSWINANQLGCDDDKIKIALYHGGVGEFETGVGFRMRGEKLLKDFEGYDFVMLGDIHKYQFIDKEEVRVAYASSLIAQNFSECDSNHGVLVWGIVNKNHEYFKIKNESGFLIIKFEEDCIYFGKSENESSIEEIEALNFPNNLNLKIIVKESSPLLIKKVVKILRSKTTDLKIHYKFIHDDNLPLTLTSSNNFNINFNESTVHQWIERYLKFRKKIDNTDLINQISNKFKAYNIDKLNIKEKSICRWELIDLQFSNLFSYGENNYIDFSKFNDSSIVGVLAPNSYGKSSLIDIILFSLFGRISRNQGHGITKDLINIEKNKFSTKLSFKIGSEIYTIDKEGRREKSGKIKITKEEFFKIKNGEKVILTEESRLKTDKILNEQIGDMQEFIFTNIQLQNRDKSFKDLTNKERKEFLHNILNLDIFESILPTITVDTKNIKSELDILEKCLKKCSIEELEQNKEQIISEINELEDTLNENKKTVLNYNSELDEYRGKLHFIDDELLEFGEDNINIVIEKYEKDKEDIIASNRIINEKIDQYNLELKSLNILRGKNKIMKEYKIFCEEKDKILKDFDKKLCEYEKQKISKINLELFYDQLDIPDTYTEDKDLKKYKNELENETIIRIENENNSLKIEEDNCRNKFLQYQESNQKKLDKIRDKNSQLINENIKLTEKLWKFDKDDEIFLDKDFQLEKEKIIRIEKENNILNESIKQCELIIQNEAVLKKKLVKTTKEKIIRDEIDDLKKELHVNKKILSKFKDHKYDPKCKYCILNPITTEITNATNKIDTLDSKIDELSKSIQYTTEDINEIESQLVTMSEKKSEQKTQSLEVKLNDSELNSCNKILSRYDKLINYQKSNDGIKIKIIENETLLKDGKNTEDKIINEINNLSIFLKNISDKINKNNTNLEGLNTKLLIINKLIKNLEKNNDIDNKNCKINFEIEKLKNNSMNKKEERHEEYDKLIEQIDIKDSIDQNIQTSTSEIYCNDKKLQNTLILIEENILKKEKIIEMGDNKITNIQINDDIKYILHLIKEINLSILELREKKGYFLNKVENISDKISCYNKSFKEYLLAKDKYMVNKYLEECIGRDGVPLMLLEQYLPIIQDHINEIIYPFINRQVSIKINGDNINFESFPSHSEHSVLIHGGMESFILDLAFKITLSKYAMLPKCDTLFLDEGISAFDKEKLSTIDTLFNFLKNHFNKIILITHIDQVKDHINEKIEIEKEGNNSKIVCFYG